MGNAPTYPGTEISVRVGDEILWHGDDPGTIVFVMSADDWLGDFADQKKWFLEQYGSGIMIETRGAGLVLESEVDSHLTLVKSFGADR